MICEGVIVSLKKAMYMSAVESPVVDVMTGSSASAGKTFRWLATFACISDTASFGS